jgi:hypothetical protein
VRLLDLRLQICGIGKLLVAEIDDFGASAGRQIDTGFEGRLLGCQWCILSIKESFFPASIIPVRTCFCEYRETREEGRRV